MMAQKSSLLQQFFVKSSANKGLPRKTVISGSVNSVRTGLAIKLANMVLENGYPVFIVHRANKIINETYASNGTCVCFRDGSESYEIDPTIGLTDSELATVFYDVGKSIADLSFESRSIIAIGLEAMHANAVAISFNSICSFPWETISEYIFKSINIANEDKLGLIQRIEPFSMQIPAVAALFKEIKVHSKDRFNSCKKKLGIGGILSRPAIVAVDIKSDVNTTFTELILSLIKLYKERGYQFLTILDSVPVLSQRSVSYQFYKSTDTHTPVVIMSQDLAQGFAGQSSMFYDVVGSGINAVVLAHTAGYSADVWSNFFGEYYYQRTDTTTGETKEKYSFFKNTEQRSVTRSEERRRAIPPETIMHLDPNQAIVEFGFLVGQVQPFEIVDLRQVN